MVQRQQLRAARALTAIELDRIQPEYVHAKANGALGEAGFGVENETLRPLLGLALGLGRVGEVAVDVEVAQVEVDLGAFNEAAFFGAGWQGQTGDGQGDHSGQCVGHRENCHGLGSLLFF